MRADAKYPKFRRETKYPHKRSEGLTWRRNRGSALQMAPKRRRGSAE